MAGPSLPGTVVGTQRMLLPFSYLVQASHPRRFGCVAMRIGPDQWSMASRQTFVTWPIGRAALAAFNLDGFDAHLQQLGQQFQRVEAGGFFDGIVILVIAHIKAPLA